MLYFIFTPVSRFFPRKTDLRGRKRRRHWRLGAWALGLLLLLALLFYMLAGRSGRWLVQDDAFERVRYAVMLDGQGPDLERNVYAAGLLQDNRVDTLIVLGRRIFRDRNAVDFYVPDLLRQAPVDPGRILVLRHDDPSTLEEAYSLVPALKRRGADTVLLITATPASRRAALLFNTLSQGKPVFIACDIGYFEYRPETWIHTREGRKHWLREWAALWYARWELLFAPAAEPVEGKNYGLEPWSMPMKEMQWEKPAPAATQAEPQADSLAP